MADTGKSKRDPILMVGAIVLAIAVVLVVGNYVYGEFVDKNSKTADYGSKVKVDYVGSYYSFYDGSENTKKDHAMVFDTSIWDVANKSEYKKSFEFDLKGHSSYKPLEFTIGDKKMLSEFENALIGMKPGETKRVVIHDGYGEAEDLVKGKSYTVSGLKMTDDMEVDALKKIFGKDIPTAPGAYTYKSILGWKCSVFIGQNGMASVSNVVSNGQTIENDNGINCNITVSGNTFSITITLNPEKLIKAESKDDPTEIVELKFVAANGSPCYITHYDSTTGEFTVKCTGEKKDIEKVGMDLYFYIKFVGFA